MVSFKDGSSYATDLYDFWTPDAKEPPVVRVENPTPVDAAILLAIKAGTSEVRRLYPAKFTRGETV